MKKLNKALSCTTTSKTLCGFGTGRGFSVRNSKHAKKAAELGFKVYLDFCLSVPIGMTQGI